MIISKAEKVFISMAATIVLLLGIILYMVFRPKPDVNTTTKTVIKWRELPADTQSHPAPEKVGETVKDIPQAVLPSGNYDSLKEQYTRLLIDYYSERYYIDSFQKDSIKVVLNDTVLNNELKGRSAIWHIKYPEYHTTITNETQQPARGQLYMGAGVGTDFKLSRLQGNISLLFKSKRDNITELRYIADTKAMQGVSVNKYIKISFRKP